MLKIFLALLFCLNAMADDTAERERILKKYGDKKQYNSVVLSQRDQEVKRKIRLYKQKLKEPDIENQDYYNKLNPVQQERYLAERRKRKEEMSAYILKNYRLVEKEDLEKIQAENKKRELSGKRRQKKEIEELDQMMKDYNNDFQASNAEIQKKFEEIKLNPNMFSKMLGEKSRASVEKMMKSNPFTRMPRDKVKSVILERTMGSPLNKWLKKNPKALEAATEVAKDKKALPSLLSILNEPSKMKSYGIGAIIIFIVTFLLNLKNTDMGIFKKIFMKIALGLGSVAANIFLFYFIFKAQVTPTIDAVMRVF